MSSERQTITVFGSGTAKENSPQFRVAYETGFALAKAGFRVANGGYGGSMLASARGAKEAGGSTIGITTDDFPNSVKNQFIDREIRMLTWFERLQKLIELGYGFVVLDGGMGTLTELAVVWEMGNKGFHEKPAVILGNRVRESIEALKHNPEVKVPKNFHMAQTPRDAVEYLKKVLCHG